MKEQYKNLIIGSSALIFFLIASFWRSYLLIEINKYGFSNFIYNFFSIFSLLIILAVLILIFKKQLIKDYHDLKLNHQTYFKTYLPYWFVALALMSLCNLILYFIVVKDLSLNEQVVRNLFQTNPFLIYVSAVIIAPILEELVFRGSFYYIFRNAFLFVLCSGLFFGLVHVSTAETIEQFLYVIPYSIPGFVFAYALYKSKNFFVPIGLHFIHNGVLVSLQMIVIFLGGFDLWKEKY